MTRPNLAVQARFAASEPAFAAQVARADVALAGVDRSGDRAADFPRCPRLIGTYWIADCHVLSEGYVFEDPLGNALVDSAGFAYLPSGPPTDMTGLGFDEPELFHLQGPWYSYDAGF